MMKIKVCGMRQADNISQVVRLGVDWIGLIFWPRSPRYVDMLPSHAGIMPDHAALAPSPSMSSPRRVGVFVDDLPQNIITRVVNFRLSAIQLHGSESPVLLRNLRRTLATDICPKLQIWKAVSISSGRDLDLCSQYEDCVDMFVFDTKSPSVGGSGRQFDWSVLQDYRGSRPFLLSGGIGPDDAGRAARFSHPLCAGVDLNSRFETAPGLKDASLIRQFISKLRTYEQDQPTLQ